jgi:hypothetical protein
MNSKAPFVRYLVLTLLLVIFVVECSIPVTQVHADSGLEDILDEQQAIENLIINTRQKILSHLPEECQALFFKAEISMHQIELLNRAQVIDSEKMQQYSTALMDQLQSDKNCDSEIMQKLFKKSSHYDNHILTLKLLVKQLELSRLAQQFESTHTPGGYLQLNEMITTDTLRQPITMEQQEIIPSEPAALPPAAEPVVEHPHVATSVRPSVTAHTLSQSSLGTLLHIGWIASIILIVGSLHVIMGSPEYAKLTKSFPPKTVIYLNYVIFIVATLLGNTVRQPFDIYFAFLGCLGIAQAKIFAIRHERPTKKPEHEHVEISPHKEKKKRPDDKVVSPGENDRNHQQRWYPWFAVSDSTMDLLVDERLSQTILPLWLIVTMWYGSPMMGYISVGAMVLAVASRLRKFKEEWTILEAIAAAAGLVCLAYTVLATICYATGIPRLVRFFWLLENGIAYLAWPTFLYGLLWLSVMKKEESPRFMLNVIYLVSYALVSILSSRIPSIAPIKNVCGASAFSYFWVKYFQFMLNGNAPKSVTYLGFGIMLFMSCLAWYSWPQHFFTYAAMTQPTHAHHHV